jgi:hypothetical protein
MTGGISETFPVGGRQPAGGLVGMNRPTRCLLRLIVDVLRKLSDALLAAGQIDSVGAGQHAIEPPLIRMFGNELSPPIGSSASR